MSDSPVTQRSNFHCERAAECQILALGDALADQIEPIVHDIKRLTTHAGSEPCAKDAALIEAYDRYRAASYALRAEERQQ